MNKRRITKRRIRSIKQALRFTLILFVAFSVMFGLFTVSKRARVYALEKDSRPKNIFYYSYDIQYGDTLWSIAEDWKWDGCSIRSYIEEVKQINHILDEDDLISDHFLILPYDGDNVPEIKK